MKRERKTPPGRDTGAGTVDARWIRAGAVARAIPPGIAGTDHGLRTATLYPNRGRAGTQPLGRGPPSGVADRPPRAGKRVRNATPGVKGSGPAGPPTRAYLSSTVPAGPLEGRLGLLGVVLADPLEHRLRCAVDQVLGLLQAEAGERADLLDHLDLLVAGRGQDDVELDLLLVGGSRRHRLRRRPGRPPRPAPPRSRRSAPRTPSAARSAPAPTARRCRPGSGPS